jgi:hypothetical protein
VHTLTAGEAAIDRALGTREVGVSARVEHTGAWRSAARLSSAHKLASG